DRARSAERAATMHVRPLGCRHQLCDRLVEQPLELGIVVVAVIGGENALMLARGWGRRLWLLLGLPRRLGQRGGRRADRKQRRAAAREQEGERGGACPRQAAGAENAGLCHCGGPGGGLRVPSGARGDLDLLRAGDLDARAVALLDPSAHPDAAVFELLRLYAGGSEDALIALRDRNGQRLRPSPAKIHVDRSCTLADRHHIPFRHGETATPGPQLPPALRCADGMLRVTPEAKPGPARSPFLGQQLLGAR